MPRAQRFAWLGLALASLIWAGNSLVARAFTGAIPPLSLAFWRWAVALLILLPLTGPSLWRHRQVLRAAGWRLWLAALLAITLYNCLLYTAALTTAAINLSLVSTCLPLATFIGAGLLLGEWPARRAWGGLGVALLGLLWLIAQGNWQVLRSLSFAQGDLLMLLATLDWALYSLLLRRWNRYFQLPPFTLLGALVLLGVLMLTPFYLWELWHGARFAASPGNLAAIGYTALFASVIAYQLWNIGLRELGAARTAMSNYLMPVFTAILGWLLLGEGLQSYHWVGGALIVSGLLLAGRPQVRT
ncbi:multidrug DMT transporter permease [Pseudomonas alcaligenes]|uniref:Multidrug DMT transporter permease n=1 Tax=Aquipseudomonas alcaligenes TaxID=43263 RepID=A0ABR7RYH3_AQUAC|nr:DMT family transporter [Pseudomonas alcaligenes]MBC9249585.1 multidrug DMT transporter permease [Pseudomonas alcaligenes]